MLVNIKNFDPIEFLELGKTLLSENDIQELQNSLSKDMEEYVLLKLSSVLTEQQLDQVLNAKEKMPQVVGTFIPDVKDKTILELENFKKEFQNTK